MPDLREETVEDLIEFLGGIEDEEVAVGFHKLEAFLYFLDELSFGGCFDCGWGNAGEGGGFLEHVLAESDKVIDHLSEFFET